MAAPYHRCPTVGSADRSLTVGSADRSPIVGSADGQRFLLPPLAQR